MGIFSQTQPKSTRTPMASSAPRAPHRFTKKLFANLQWCGLCELYIWPTQGAFWCAECHMFCHKDCLKKLHSTEKSSGCPGAANRPRKGSPLVKLIKAGSILEKKTKLGQSQGSAPTPSDIPRRERKPSCMVELFRDNHEVFRSPNVHIQKAVSNTTNEPVMIKTVKCHRKLTGESDHELERLREMEHEHLICLRQAFVSDRIFVLTSEVADGDRFFRPLWHRDYITEADVSRIVGQLVSGLRYLHSQKVVHGMVRPEFLYLHPETHHLKMSEFGVWKVAGKDVIRDVACSIPYQAPEILENRGIGRASDMWCVGVITYLLLSGTPPFYGNSMEAISESIIKADFDYPEELWDCVSDDAIDFIDALLVGGATAKRMSSAEALEHPFLQSPTHTVLHNVPERLESTMQLYLETMREVYS